MDSKDKSEMPPEARQEMMKEQALLLVNNEADHAALSYWRRPGMGEWGAQAKQAQKEPVAKLEVPDPSKPWSLESSLPPDAEREGAHQMARQTVATETLRFYGAGAETPPPLVQQYCDKLKDLSTVQPAPVYLAGPKQQPEQPSSEVDLALARLLAVSCRLENLVNVMEGRLGSVLQTPPETGQ